MEYQKVKIEYLPNAYQVHVWADEGKHDTIAAVAGVHGVLPIGKTLYSIDIDHRYQPLKVIEAIEAALS